MGRHAIGDHPMTSSERQRRYLAKLAAPRPAPAPAKPPAADGLVLKVAHIRMAPTETASWLYQRLGHDAAVAFRDALNRAIEQGR